jgi:hypothetical protein
MNSYQATMHITGKPDIKFDLLKLSIDDALEAASKLGRLEKFNADSVEVKNNQLHKGTEDYILKTVLK